MRAKAKSRAFVLSIVNDLEQFSIIGEFIAMGFSLHVSSTGKDRAHNVQRNDFSKQSSD